MGEKKKTSFLAVFVRIAGKRTSRRVNRVSEGDRRRMRMVWQFFFPRHVRQLSTSDSGMKKESVNCVDPPEACIYFFFFFKKKRQHGKENVGRRGRRK